MQKQKLIISCMERIPELSEVWVVDFKTWRRGAKFEVAPRRHFLWNLKCKYFRKERSCGAKTFMANRSYNVCYAESIVLMFHELIRFIPSV